MGAELSIENHRPVPLAPLHEVLKECKAGDAVFVGPHRVDGDSQFRHYDVGWTLLGDDGYMTNLEHGYCLDTGSLDGMARKLQPGERLTITYKTE